MGEFEWFETFQSERNRLGFALRNFLAWGLGEYQEVAESKQDLFNLDSSKPAQTLLSRYNLAHLYKTATRQRYLETLAYLEWLDYFHQTAPQAFSRLPANDLTLRWLDAGAKNWAYVEALTAFIQTHYQAEFRLDGVELDSNRRYTNLKTRRQAALAYIRELPEATYHEANLLHWTQKADIISHFLPFVFKDPHLDWGLPLDYFEPKTLLVHLLTLLEPEGMMLIVNQGEAEANEQETLLAEAALEVPVSYQYLGVLPSSFIPYKYSRYGWLCVKQGA